MQPINVLPKIYPVINKHAFEMYFLIFSPSIIFAVTTNIIKSILECTKGLIFVIKIHFKTKNYFPNQSKYLLFYIFTTDWFLAYLCILCIPLYHVYVLSPTYKHFFHSNADWNKIKFVISVFECYFIIHHLILNLFVRFFGVGIVVLSEIILTKKVDTNKNEINFSMWYILFSFLPIRQKGLMKECTTLLYTSPLTHDLASQNRTLSSH